MPKITSFSDDALIAIDNLQDTASGIFSPTIRLGVTGLSRAGKTVFISALVHNLVHGGRLPMFEAMAGGRIAKAELRPQPDMDLPRFQYEEHIETLLDKRLWPQSTRTISELRLRVEYESASTVKQMLGRGSLNIDIVDYPGEWLLDLPLLGLSYIEWSRQTISRASSQLRTELAADWLKATKKAKPDDKEDEKTAIALAGQFTQYLRACRANDRALSTLPPGRFLMPGDLEGSPALTFAPLDIDTDHSAPSGSLHAMMAARYEAYKDVVVRPFFRNHFARLDRQIVLVDALAAINAGTEALNDLENALAQILSCFKTGSQFWLSPLVGRRIDKILFAATKADHLHHENHQRLENLLKDLVKNASERARFSGASVEAVALAAIRATKEAEISENGEIFPVIVGTPLKGERIGDQSFDGETETAIFPGDLPENPGRLLGLDKGKAENEPLDELQFVRFRPPDLERTDDGLKLFVPHIRLDRALEFLFGDQLV